MSKLYLPSKHVKRTQGPKIAREPRPGQSIGWNRKTLIISKLQSLHLLSRTLPYHPMAENEACGSSKVP